jgi:predicted acetyltransferase
MPIAIRRGTPEDVGPILDLLTEYGRPRSYFEPFYLRDSSYRPEHSWVVEHNGRLASHLRVYDRWIRISQATLHIAGIGNVITAEHARGQGYAGKLMQAMLPVLQQEGYAYSLLWTHLPDLYGRYGWVPIEQELLWAVLPPLVLGPLMVRAFQPPDLPRIMRIYEAANAERTGTLMRTPEYWREQPGWLHEHQDNFLVAHTNAEAAPVGYVRSRRMENAVEILELGFEGDSLGIGRTLLATVSMGCDGQLQGQFPPSLRTIFLPGEYGIVPDPGLMGRVINLAELLHVLEPLWRERVRKAGVREGAFFLSTSAGPAAVQVTEGQLQIDLLSDAAEVSLLDERELAHLLFHGFDERAYHVLGKRRDSPFLQVLFPEQDFVIWQADAF